MSTASRPASSAAAVTVSIVSHGQCALVERLLGDLARLDPPALAALLLTLNVPGEPAPPIPPALAARTQVLRNPVPRSFAANHNAALALTATPWFALLNPDLRLAHDPFAPLLAAAGPRDGLLAPRVLAPDGSTADSARPLITPLQVFWHLDRARRRRAAAELDWIAGMFWLVRSDALRAIGGLDEGYRMYCEDADACLRLQLAGWSLRLVDGVSVEHAARHASRRSLRHFLWHVASLLRHWRSAPYARYRQERHALLARRTP